MFLLKESEEKDFRGADDAPIASHHCINDEARRCSWVPQVLFTLNSPAEGASGKQFAFLKLLVKWRSQGQKSVFIQPRTCWSDELESCTVFQFVCVGSWCYPPFLRGWKPFWKNPLGNFLTSYFLSECCSLSFLLMSFLLLLFSLPTSLVSVMRMWSGFQVRWRVEQIHCSHLFVYPPHHKPYLWHKIPER